MMIRMPLALMLGLAAVSCTPAEPQTNDLSFAHYNPRSSLGGPLGRLVALRLSFETNYDQIAVCVEGSKETMSDSELLLETKLSYASWLQAASNDEFEINQDDFDLFAFSVQEKCDRNDDALGAVVVLAEESTLEDGHEDLSRFSPATIQCQRTGRSSRCGQASGGMILGWGGPGSISQYYNSRNPNRWTKLVSHRPASAVMSPYVAWLSIKEAIKRSETLSEAAKESLTTRYEELESTEANFAELNGLHNELAKHNVLGSKDSAFNRLFQEFMRSNESSMTRGYKPEYTYYSTMNHEVGHQFGMAHSDNPSHSAITGESVESSTNERGQHVSDAASMAYGLPYLYLTDDDRKGSLSNREHLVELLETHR